MSAALLAPAGLLALAALALPLLVHLARRTEARTTPFAALRWLRPKPRPRRRPRFDERRLLLVRLALLAVLAVGLAHPVLRGGPQAARWVAAAPGVDPARARAASRGARGVWLADGFPDLRRPAPPGPAPLASLLRQLDAALPPGAALTVLVPAVIEGADAERPRLSRAVAWRTLPGATASSSAPPAAPDPPLVLRASAGREGEVRYLRAAALAWAAPPAAPRLDAADVGTPLPPDARRLAWWAAGPPPEALRRRVERGATLLLPSDADVRALGAGGPLARDAAGTALAEGGALGRGRWRRLLRPLAAETEPAVLEPDFPARLHALFTEPPPAPARVRAADYAPLTGARPGGPTDRDLRPALALGAAALFALERLLATRAGRAPAP